jgi:hypothetical protein
MSHSPAPPPGLQGMFPSHQGAASPFQDCLKPCHPLPRPVPNDRSTWRRAAHPDLGQLKVTPAPELPWGQPELWFTLWGSSARPSAQRWPPDDHC